MLTAIGAILTAWGLFCLFWLFFGTMLMPTGDDDTLFIHILATGDGGDIEQTIYALGWLRRSGLLSGTVCIVDGGLSPKGVAHVEYLCSKCFDTIRFLHTEGGEHHAETTQPRTEYSPAGGRP